MANLVYATQNFSTTLNVGGGIDDSQTSGIVLTSVAGLDTNGGILCFDWAETLDTATAEYIEYAGISGNTLTGVTRGVEGLSAKAHINGSTIVCVMSEAHINRINDKLEGTDTDGVVLAEINDSNGNEEVKFTATGSAVNELTVTNAATGNPPSIAATGGDTNIDLKLLSKGTGVLTVTGTTDYEDNVTDDDDIPNKAYVDDEVAGISVATDGWTSSADTWTYASATTFTIAGVDRTAIYTKGTKLKFTQTTAKYAVVISSSFSTNTTVTIATNTSYTIANAAITSPYYSYQTNPAAWPGWFAVAAPTFDVSYLDNGSGGQPTTTECRMEIEGRKVTIHLSGTGTKATTNNFYILTLNGFPALANTSVRTALGSAYLFHSGSTDAVGIAYLSSSNNLICYHHVSLTDNVTVTGFGFTISYEI